VSHCDVELSERERQRRQHQREQSFSLKEWCAARRLSPAMFYKLRQRGQAPRTYRVGRKVLISPDADAEWLREREAEASA
jgi:hypothetical protein